jgi:hypothetical protein
MPTLEDLVTQGYSGGPLTEEARAQLEEQLLAGQRGEIERVHGDRAREINEGTFGRGLGLSTVTRDLQSERERIRQETLIKAAREAAIAARQAQAAALGQAASFVSAQGGRQLQQQGLQQQAGQFKKGLQQQQQTGREQMIGGGLAGLAGAGLKTAGMIYGPEFKDWMKGKGGGAGTQVLGPPSPGPSPLEAQGPESPYIEPSPGGGEFAGYPNFDYGDTGEYAPTSDLSGLWDLGDFPSWETLPDFDPNWWDDPSEGLF